MGAGFVAYFMAHLGGWTSKDPVREFVMANAVKKIDLKFGVAFLRGIGANWLVCLAWWQAISSNVRQELQSTACVPLSHAITLACTRMYTALLSVC